MSHIKSIIICLDIFRRDVKHHQCDIRYYFSPDIIDRMRTVIYNRIKERVAGCQNLLQLTFLWTNWSGPLFSQWCPCTNFHAPTQKVTSDIKIKWSYFNTIYNYINHINNHYLCEQIIWPDYYGVEYPTRVFLWQKTFGWVM